MRRVLIAFAVLLVAAVVATAAFCPKCGHEAAQGAKFCQDCGTGITGAAIPGDFTGTWDMIENGNEVTLIIRQEGNKITGEFIAKKGPQRSKIVGTVSVSSDQWKIPKIEFTRIGEINDYVGYMMTHGEDGGPFQNKAMAGSFLRREIGCNCGWFATRTNPRRHD
jgi:hypothetical protein